MSLPNHEQINFAINEKIIHVVPIRLCSLPYWLTSVLPVSF